ncbi:hypothetical protein C8J56DRAFT_1158550 [Mycena floridula]|nr:hypothetical protein C8J56DRAFT_1158550 [Mycena floridula]
MSGHEHSFEIPQHLLTTNDPPLFAEEQSLRDLLRAVTSRICEKSAPDELEVLQGKSLLIHAILSAARRIPSEIIGEFILHALGFHGPLEKREKTTLDAQKGIWVYARVSRIWRAAALAIPAAWAVMDIRGAPVDDRFSPFSPNILSTIFSRSRSCPLHIALHLLSDSQVEKELLKLIVAKCFLWEDVSLTMVTKCFSELRRIRARLPLLQSIELLPISHKAWISTKSFGACFKEAPCLRRIRFGSLDAKDLQLPWGQITHFCDERGGFSYKHIHNDKVLALLPNLIHLASNTYQHLNGQVNLPHLRFFRIESIGVLEGMLQHLVLPNLEILEGPFFTPPSLQVTLITMLHRCSLKTLIVKNSESVCRQTFLDMTLLLRAIPSVTSLFVTYSLVLPNFHLKPIGQATLLPNLQLLGLGPDTLLSAEETALVIQLIESRWSLQNDGMTRIKELRFISPPDEMHLILMGNMADNYALILDAFRDKGLLVTVASDSDPFP